MIQRIDQPNRKPDIIGAQNEILGFDVHASQKKAIAKEGPANIATSRRFSGGTGRGAYSKMARS